MRVEGLGAGTTIKNDAFRPQRNKPCPCGSGKKFKRCHFPEWMQTLIDESLKQLDMVREMAAKKAIA